MTLNVLQIPKKYRIPRKYRKT